MRNAGGKTVRQRRPPAGDAGGREGWRPRGGAGGWLARAGVLTAFAGVLLGLWAHRRQPALGTDSLIYHLTLPAHWLHDGYLATVDLPFHDGNAQHSPMLAETLWYLLMRLTGDDGLTWLVQPAFLLAIFWLYYRTARLLGAGKPLALLLTAMMMDFQPFLTSAIIANNELVLTAGAALFLYGLSATRLPSGWPMACAAGGVGLMLATKYVGVVYAGAAVIVAAAPAWRHFRRRWTAGRGRALAEGGTAVALLLLGGVFLLRNWWLYGNPMYPAQVRLGPWTIFSGLYDNSALVGHGLSFAKLARLLFGEVGGNFALEPLTSGPLWAAFALAGVFWLTRRRGRHGAPGAVCLAFPILSAGAFFAVTPFWEERRLLFPVYYCLWLSAAYAAGLPIRGGGPAAFPALWRRVRRGAFWMLLAGWAILYFVFWPWALEWLGVFAVVSLVAAALWPKRSWRRSVLPAAAGGLILAVAAGPLWCPAYQAERRAARAGFYATAYGPVGQVWSALESVIGPGRPGATIAYAGSAIVYPLFGPQLANRVVYVPVSPQDVPQPTKLAGGPVSPQLAGQRRQAMDPDYWLAGLRRQGVGFLYLDDDPNTGGAALELRAARENPEVFVPLLESGRVRVFRVNPDRLSGQEGQHDHGERIR